LCVKETYTYKIVERMYVVIEGLLECVAVEIGLETKQKACVYTAQGSKVEVFKDKLTELVDCTMLNKTMWLCGDVNVDLMNPQGQTVQVLPFIYFRFIAHQLKYFLF